MVVYWAIRGLIFGDMRHLEHRFILLLSLFQFNQRMVRCALVEVLYVVIFLVIGRHLTLSDIKTHAILDDDVHL